MSSAEIALLEQKFVPVVFNSVNKSLPQDKTIWKEVFHSWTKGAALPLEGRLPGTNTLFLFTASGRPVAVDPALRNQTLGRRLQAGLDAFARLPEVERAPAEVKASSDLGALRYASGGGRYSGAEPPPGRLVLRAYQRLLTRDGQGEYRLARVNVTQFQTEQVDPSGRWCGHEGHPLFKAEGSAVLEPTKDMFWLLEPEWQALVPAGARKGDRIALPLSACRRLFLYGCHNWWAAETLIKLWGPEALRQQDLAVTVTEVSPKQITLRLDGTFQMEQAKPHRAAYKGRVAGLLCYDRAKKAFSRFDMVVLGEYEGIFFCRPKTTLGPMPIAYAFELAQPACPADDVLPIGLLPHQGGKRYLEVAGTDSGTTFPEAPGREKPTGGQPARSVR
jgi:hypothetical protein